MRRDLQAAVAEDTAPASAHPGLLYERYVPLFYGDEPPPSPEKKTPEIGKVLPEVQQRLLSQVAGIPISPAYRVAWRRWHAALQASGAVTGVVEATGRLLIGHGNPAPTEVGITLHHVYGVPLLPGTALKGLLNHYLATWGAVADAGWEGVRYDEQGRPVGAPGRYHRAIFGVPNLPLDEGRKQAGQIGGVVFEDAWLIPGPNDFPLCPDVLTPHQGDYYRRYGGELPNDWTDPNPVTFLTVKPKTRFLLAASPLQAEREGAELAMAHLLDALEQCGLGAKTCAGYGRLRRVTGESPRTAESPPPGRGTTRVPLTENLLALQAAVSAVLDPPDRDSAPPIAQRLDQHITDELLEALGRDEYPKARELLKGLCDHAGLKKRRKERLDQITRKVSQ